MLYDNGVYEYLNTMQNILALKWLDVIVNIALLLGTVKIESSQTPGTQVS